MASAVESAINAEYHVLDGLTPHIGYRCWKVFDNKLYPPVHSNRVWNPGLVRSVCIYSMDEQPCADVNCRCGLYAVGENYSGQFRDHYFNLDTGQINRRNMYSLGGGIILGAVLLFDTKIISRNGFVCGRYGIVTGFIQPHEGQYMTEETTDAIAARYGVDVVDSMQQLRETATGHPLMQQYQTAVVS